MNRSSVTQYVIGASICLTIVAGLVALVVISPSHATARAAGSQTPPAPTPQVFPGFGLQLALVGLDRPALKAAGLTELEQQSVTAAAGGWLANHADELSGAYSGYRAAKKEAPSGQASASAETPLIGSISSSRGGVQTAKTALFDAAIQGLSNEQVAKLRTIRSLRWTGHAPEVLVRSTTVEAASNAREQPAANELSQ